MKNRNIILTTIPFINELVNIITETVKIEFEKQNKLSIPKQDNDYITRKQAAQILGITLPTLNEYTKRGLIPSFKIGSQIRYKKDEVLKSVNERLFPKN